MQDQTRELIQAQKIHIQQMQAMQEQVTRPTVQSFPELHVKPPQIDIIPFNGNIMNWTTFWDSFEATIHKNARLPVIEKFAYLKTKLINEALDSISGLSVTSENYEIAIQILKERFSDKEAVINAHYVALMELPVGQDTTNSLRHVYDEIEKHLRCLEAQGQDITQDIFVTLITSKLPKNVLTQLQLQKPITTKWTVTLLRESVKNYLGARETVDRQFTTPCSKESKTLTHVSKQSYKPTMRTSTEALMSHNKTLPKMICRYCDKEHWSDQCSRYATLESRKERIKGSCYICLKKGHMIKDCQVDKPCIYCHQRKNHHRSLCPKQLSTKREYQHLANSVSDTETHNPVMMASNEAVLMQTATTEIQSPDSDKSVSVRLLFDSGSYRTYITEQMAKKLKLKFGKTKEQISVMTFGPVKPVELTTRVSRVLCLRERGFLVVFTTCGAEKPQIITTPTASLKLKLRDGSFFSIKANVVPAITGVIQRMPIDTQTLNNWNYLWKDIALADTLPTTNESSLIDVLIGNDYYLDLILPQQIQVHQGLYLLGSKLGWILTGRTAEPKSQIVDTVSMLSLTSTPVTESLVFATETSDPSLPTKPDITNFWKLETIGITDCPNTNDDDIALHKFNMSIQYNNGRYFVTWPWKSSDINLPTNYQLAYGRFKSLIQKFRFNTELLTKYNSIIKDQLDKGMIEKVNCESDNTKKHYIPHHPVINPSRETTKVRIVYDASAKVVNSQPSLNDCLYRGPVMLKHLCGLLLRFRLHQVCLHADIEKAFLQVGLQVIDRDVTRFLWLKNPDVHNLKNNIQIYRFTRVPFGIVSSPFLLAATIMYHLNQIGSKTANHLKENIYVDNVITGCSDKESAQNFYSESKDIFASASMNLREWSSNSQEFLSCIPEQDRAKGEIIKVLGLLWFPEVDKMTVRVSHNDQKPCSTKRDVLKTLSSVFDPLGFFSPITLKAKVFMQDLWVAKIGWDEALGHRQNYWNQVQSEIQQIQVVRIPRFVGDSSDYQAEYELCCFCDASKHAYSAVVYLRSSKTQNAQLLMSKVRVAPVKQVSVPRLELLALLIGVRLIQFVKKELNLNIGRLTVWTDSLCVLNWLVTKKPLPCFVGNRLREIRSYTDVHFQYVPTEQNPADVATRGCTVTELQQIQLWKHGPDWLLLPVEKRPSWNVNTVYPDAIQSVGMLKKPEIIFETKLLSGNTVKSTVLYPFDIDVSAFSSITRLYRTTSWCIRFINKARRRSTERGPLTAEELQSSKRLWEQAIQGMEFGDMIIAIKKGKFHNLQRQLGVKLDNNGVLRCSGRLQFAELKSCAREPKLLPSKHPFTKLVIKNFHAKYLHAGTSHTLSLIRQEYWIPRGRSTVKDVLQSCNICRRWEGGPFKAPTMPPLPQERVRQSPPFAFTGLDYLGPLYVKNNDSSEKAWVCLFTCLASRAIHLEILSDMSANSFLLCFRRFIARYGKPQQIYSDNAKQFKAANKTLEMIWTNVVHHSDVSDYCSKEGIKWNFIVERAPWMGGFYERMVGLVKRSLRKAIGKVCLTQEQLTTLLMEIEAIINARPLLYIDDDIDSKLLTPADLLGRSSVVGVPAIAEEDSPEYTPKRGSYQNLLNSWKTGQRPLNNFWRTWKNDYLQNLRERGQTKLKGPRVESNLSPKVGDIVLLKDNLPRGVWRLGQLKELIESADKKVRAAKVRISSGKIFTRSIKLLYPIECPAEDTLMNY